MKNDKFTPLETLNFICVRGDDTFISGTNLNHNGENICQSECELRFCTP